MPVLRPAPGQLSMHVQAGTNETTLHTQKQLDGSWIADSNAHSIKRRLHYQSDVQFAEAWMIQEHFLHTTSQRHQQQQNGATSHLLLTAARRAVRQRNDHQPAPTYHARATAHLFVCHNHPNNGPQRTLTSIPKHFGHSSGARNTRQRHSCQMD